jgi:hypothetical protein
MASTTRTIDLTGGKLQESIVGVATTEVGPGEVHGIRDVESSINTSILSSRKTTNVAVSNKTVASTSSRTSTQTSVETKNWDGTAPFIRARDIYCRGFGLMGNRVHYPYMDNIKINKYCQSVTRLYVTSSNIFLEDTLATFKDINDVIVGTGTVLSVTKFYNELIIYLDILTGTVANTNTIIQQSDKIGTVDFVVLGGVDDPSLITDKWGGILFKYKIPAGIFQTGNREIRLSDIDDAFEPSTRSSASGTYLAEGSVHYKQKVTTNKVVKTVTKTTTNTTTKVTTNNITNTVNKVKATNIHYNDPLAHTFIVNDETHPSGVFISSIDLFFKNKPSQPIPITIQIRNVINGTPVSFEYLYNAQKKLLPSDVNISSDASAITNVKFTNPIYLVPGEYAIVLISNSDEYEVFIATLGKKQIGSNIVISESPNLGVLLKSSNASTWTPMQEADLTFRINRAVFSSEGTVQFDVSQKVIGFTGNLLSGSNYITNISLNDNRNDILDLYLNYNIESPDLPSGTYILEIDAANNRIKLSENASATLSSAPLLCYPDFDYSLLSFNVGTETPTGTETSWKARVLDKATDQLQEYSNQQLGAVFDFKSLKTIKHPNYNSNRIPLRVTGTLYTSDSKLSPILDYDSLFAKATKNIINNNSDFETTPSGGHADAVYFTRKMPLADGFDASNLTVIFDAYRPSVCTIKVYYKVSSVDSNDPFDNNDWVEMAQTSNQQASISEEDLKEYTFIPANSVGTYGIPVDDPINPRFNMYSIKIVMLSSDESYTPIIRNIRGIALDN